MGFFDKMAESAGKKVGESKERYNKTYASAKRMDDEKVARKMMDSTNMADKFAYAKTLKDRGYGSSNDD